ncbi:MAG: cytochrome P450 [Acidimicrobiales bacterium]
MTAPVEITVSTYEQARDAFRRKELRQALYDEGDVVMADVLVNLHGDDHRARRRLENRLFRKDTHARYERELFPPIVAATLAPHVARGRAELVGLSHELMMNLAASTAGVDRPLGTADETRHLYRYLMVFIEGATLAHRTGDRDAKRAEVAAAMAAFDEEFLAPSIARRRALLAEVAAGARDEADLPRDVLTTLLRNEDDLHLPDDVVLREICFFLLAGAHTSATAFVRTLHQVLELEHARPDDVARAGTDLAFLQRCVHETVRLQPSSPIAQRWALADVELAGGVAVPAGARVTIDLMAANRDPAAFGDDADAFDPHRELPAGVAPWGLSFGLGMHACIGQDLAAGIDPMGRAPEADHLFGLVPTAVQAVLDAGARRIVDDPPTIDPESTRGYWGRYPVAFPT